MTPADFAAELRARLDRLPEDEHGYVILSAPDDFAVSKKILTRVYAALTAPPPREEPQAFTETGTASVLAHKNPTPPAPEDGTRDTGWVVSQGMGREFLVKGPEGPQSRTVWATDLSQALRWLSQQEAEAFCWRHFKPGMQSVRRVRRQPGPRRWEQREEYTGMHICDCTGVIKYNVRPLISAPGPWQLDEEGMP